MVYLTPDNMRSASLAEFAIGLDLTDDEAETTRLAASIARWSFRFDLEAVDHFEPATLTLELDGDGTPQLELPYRCTAITTIKTRDNAGNLTTQPSTVYRLHSSLDSAGANPLDDRSRDWVEIIPYTYLTLAGQVGWTNWSAGWAWGSVWPPGPQTVQVVGTFGWTTTPADVKRAIAMLCYRDFKPQADVLQFATQWSSGSAVFSASATTPFGIPFVDATLKTYSHMTNRYQVA
jgi:hypothetical protein